MRYPIRHRLNARFRVQLWSRVSAVRFSAVRFSAAPQLSAVNPACPCLSAYSSALYRDSAGSHFNAVVDIWQGTALIRDHEQPRLGDFDKSIYSIECVSPFITWYPSVFFLIYSVRRSSFLAYSGIHTPGVDNRNLIDFYFSFIGVVSTAVVGCGGDDATAWR